MTPLAPDEVPIFLSLDPIFQPFALAHRSACLSQGIPFHFRSGWRSYGHQLLLYELNVTFADDVNVTALLANHPEFKATTPAKPGTSKHERAFAYDADHGNALQTAIFGSEAERLGLVWGGRFQPRPDYAHVEAPDDLATLDAYRALCARRLT